MSDSGKNRPLHPAIKVPDPPATGWTRKDSGPELTPAAAELRKDAELAADRDLEKPLEQLLSDVYERNKWWNARANDAVKRGEMSKETAAEGESFTLTMALISSMNARVALENRKMSRGMSWMTAAIMILSAALVFLTIVLICLAKSGGTP